jgi:hypothetical protein
MNRPPRERWCFTVELPCGLPNPGRFVARSLKHLLRIWNVRCVALDVDSEVRRLQRELDAARSEKGRNMT